MYTFICIYFKYYIIFNLYLSMFVFLRQVTALQTPIRVLAITYYHQFSFFPVRVGTTHNCESLDPCSFLPHWFLSFLNAHVSCTHVCLCKEHSYIGTVFTIKYSKNKRNDSKGMIILYYL